jgi:hypothetical protein
MHLRDLGGDVLQNVSIQAEAFIARQRLSAELQENSGKRASLNHQKMKVPKRPV